MVAFVVICFDVINKMSHWNQLDFGEAHFDGADPLQSLIKWTKWIDASFKIEEKISSIPNIRHDSQSWWKYHLTASLLSFFGLCAFFLWDCNWLCLLLEAHSYEAPHTHYCAVYFESLRFFFRYETTYGSSCKYFACSRVRCSSRLDIAKVFSFKHATMSTSGWGEPVP